jgi:alkylation response protein AidB-like acyl-CoA dehydrogenase
MSWTLDEDQRLLRDSAQAFVAERLPVAHLRALRDGGDTLGHSPERWRELGRQGYTATLVPEALGGLGLGLVQAGLVAEQLGHTLAPVPFVATAVLAATLLKGSPNAALQAAWLPRVAAADAVLALALDDTAHHQPQALALRAQRQGSNGWCLNGHKQAVVAGQGADALIIAAQADDGVALLLLPRGTPGLQVQATVTLDAQHAARVALVDVLLDDSALLAPPAQGRVLLDQALDAGRAVLAAELLGLADEVFERTVAYLQQRRQFDRIIGEFQALQHRAAELFCDLELTRAIVRQALKALDDGAANAPLLAAQAKARAGLTANRAVQEGVQMHGGIGMTDELDMGLFMKRARALQAWLGDAHFQMDRAAVLSGY